MEGGTLKCLPRQQHSLGGKISLSVAEERPSWFYRPGPHLVLSHNAINVFRVQHIGPQVAAQESVVKWCSKDVKAELAWSQQLRPENKVTRYKQAWGNSGWLLEAGRGQQWVWLHRSGSSAQWPWFETYVAKSTLGFSQLLTTSTIFLVLFTSGNFVFKLSSPLYFYYRLFC